MRRPYKLINTIQEYAWGSPRLMPELLGWKNPEEKPFAEMWMGVHPRGPSVVEDPEGNRNLSDFIKSSPERVLGKEISERFGGELPFLFKVLSAGKPLSIQAHPDKKQAEEGFEREERKGVPLDAFSRNYRDRNHKPEVICALTPFTAMCGFKTAAEIAAGFENTEAPAVRSKLLPPLSSAEVLDEADKIRGFFNTLMTLDAEDKEELVRGIVSWAGGDSGEEARLVLRFHELHGTDIGVAAPLYLNVLTLQEGQALYQPAGVLHAYVEGMGVELMANSDNVLRGGLTQKHVDVEELLSLLSFRPIRPDIITPVETLPKVDEYPLPIDEFVLRRVRVEGADVEISRRTSLEIGICTEGECTLLPSAAANDGDYGETETSRKGAFSSLTIERGESFVVPHDFSSYRLSGEGKVYIAAVPSGS
ncbi:MAG: mannose-6-phosphate isomerase, class I [Spirochaetaceae bacterium]